jgi:oligogalacturonide transporter
MAQERTVKLRNLIAYGVGDIYGGGSFLIISLLFMYFLTDTVGLPGTLAGAVMLPGKVWDAISDPLMGYISDNMKSRYGRRRIFFLWGILPVALSFMLMWVTVRFANPYLTFAYYSFIFILFRTAFTMVMVPYSALNAEMTTDYKVRMRLSGTRMIFSQGSSLVCAVIPKMIMDRYFEGSPEQGFLFIAVIFGIFFALPWIIVFLGTWEIASAKKQEAASMTGFFKNLSSLFINRSFKIHMGMYIFSYAAMDILMAVFIYFLTHYMGRPELFSKAVGAMLLAQVSMLPFYVWLANKKGKGFSYRTGLSIWGTAMIVTLFVNPGLPDLSVILISVMIGSGMSAGTMIPWAILPSVTDVDEMITADQRAGSYAGAMTFIRKIVNALTIFIFGVLLDLIGYLRPVRETVDGVVKVIDQTQTDETRMWLKLIFSFAPLLLIITGFIIALKFKITPATHAVLVAEIRRLKEGGARKDVTPGTRQVCEELTGLKYEELYRKR